MKEKILKGEQVIGAFLGIYSPSIVEMIGYAGFDFIVIDDEHGAFSHSELENIIRTAESVQLLPIVRVSYDESSIQKALDRGAKGIQVPMVNTKEKAKEVVSKAKFPPLGTRGAAYSHRAARYGKDSGKEFLDIQDEETLIIVHIETPQAVENFEEIAAVPGIDLAFIGSTDLSVNMGHKEKGPLHPEVKNIIDSLFEKGKQLGVPIGSVASDGKSMKDWLEKGSSYVGVVGTSVISAALQDTFKIANEVIKTELVEK